MSGITGLPRPRAAIVAPTALVLVTTTFPEDPPQPGHGRVRGHEHRGAAVGLMAGGLLTSVLPWRWVLFVNVSIGVVVALLAPRAIAAEPREESTAESPRATPPKLRHPQRAHQHPRPGLAGLRGLPPHRVAQQAQSRSFTGLTARIRPRVQAGQ
jgi:MFS family permease